MLLRALPWIVVAVACESPASRAPLPLGSAPSAPPPPQDASAAIRAPRASPEAADAGMASVDAASPPLATGLLRIERRWIDLGPPPSTCPPPRACSSGSIVVDRDCNVSGDNDGRDFRARADAKACAEVFAIATRAIAPRMNKRDPCTRWSHHGGARLALETIADDGGLVREEVHVDGCYGTEPWKGFVAKLLALHP